MKAVAIPIMQTVATQICEARKIRISAFGSFPKVKRTNVYAKTRTQAGGAKPAKVVRTALLAKMANEGNALWQKGPSWLPLVSM